MKTFNIDDARNCYTVASDSVDLIVTSPPYYNLKDYDINGQIGYGSSYTEYLSDMTKVWRQCYRVLKDGCRMCINVGDVFVRAQKRVPHSTIPLHADVIKQCIDEGFIYCGMIIWHKITNKNTSGGSTFILGSYPYPPNGIIRQNFEYILLFKKHGQRDSSLKSKESELSKEEWLKYFDCNWSIAGESQRKGHIARFPTELPMRLIKMFSFVGETVFDPFVGSGTTIDVAEQLNRNSIGIDLKHY